VLAGVSRATVSRVVNGSPRVSPAVRETVEHAVAELGYVPNLAARSLVTQRTDAVACVVSEPESRIFSDPFFGSVIRGVSRGLASEGLQMLLLMVQSAEDYPRVARFMAGGHVDGALMFSLHEGDPLPRIARDLGLPAVFGGRPWTTGPDVSYVDADNRGGGRSATQHLIDRGCHRIATITGPLDHLASLDRLAGFEDAFADAAAPVSPQLVVCGDFTQEGGQRAMEQLLLLEPPVDGVFCSSDPMAAGALRALRSAGRKVPDDVAVVGFDDHEQIAAWTDPPLTTVHQDPDFMGEMLVKLLVTRLRGEPVPEPLVLPTRLVVRESA
jgi:DNA-binding LacI/PurR family transcriptional regulator